MENSTKVVTGKVRFCFCHVFEPSAMEGQPEESAKYSVCVIIPKSDTHTIEKIKKAIEAAKTVGKSKLADKNGKIPSTIKLPLRDGDEERSDDEAFADFQEIYSTALEGYNLVVDAYNANKIPTTQENAEYLDDCYEFLSLLGEVEQKDLTYGDAMEFAEDLNAMLEYFNHMVN